MKISELMNELKRIQEKYGDLAVELATYRLKPSHDREYPWVDTMAEFETGHAPIEDVYVRERNFSRRVVITKRTD